jgi:hypothetical protein
MYDVSIAMAIVDFVPVVLFLVATVILQRDLYNKMPKYAFACFAAGTIDVFVAGFLKALWKLLYAMGVCDFHTLNTMFLPTQSIGLLLAGFGIILMLTNRKKYLLAAAAPPVFSGTFVFVGMMVFGLGAICGGLSVVAKKMKKARLMLFFLLAFICYLAMGYLSSRDSTSAAVNWIEQGVNTLGQILLLIGVIGLHNAGLRELKLA